MWEENLEPSSIPVSSWRTYIYYIYDYTIPGRKITRFDMAHKL